MIMIILENTSTNIHRSSAYTDEVHLLIMQAAAGIAGECYRVKCAVLQRPFFPCVSNKMVTQRALSTLAQSFTWPVSVTPSVEKGTAILNTLLGIHGTSLLFAMAL